MVAEGVNVGVIVGVAVIPGVSGAATVLVGVAVRSTVGVVSDNAVD